MDYIKRLIIVLTIYHFSICSITSFAHCEILYFNVNEWDKGARFFYSVVFLICAAASIGTVYDDKTKGR